MDHPLPNPDPGFPDLSLFKLPVVLSSPQVEVPVSNRWGAKEESKQLFWQRLARRIDLTGEGSPVETTPYGSRQAGTLTALGASWERFESEVEKHYEGGILRNLGSTRDLNRSYEVESALKTVTAQFFLRNVPRVLRDVQFEVRRPRFSYVDWTDHMYDYFAEVRAFQIESLPFLEEFSIQWLPKLGQERRAMVTGFSWEDSTELFLKRGGGYFPIRTAPPLRISINDLSLAPAPPYRSTSWKEDHLRTMKDLSKLFDGSV
ncbi:MAG: hypothetical protein JW797_17790 [Bradymonadales bacterium]|nr:hypothetical protein [Bradymonadales bacterium]